MISLQDKLLRADVDIIREIIQKNETSRVTFAPTKFQLADCSTKKGCCTALLLEVLITNQL